MDTYYHLVKDKLKNDYVLEEEDYKQITQDIMDICLNIGEEITTENMEFFLNEYIKSNAIIRYKMNKEKWR